MSNEQMQPLLRTWFRDRRIAPTDVPNGVAQVMARVPEVRQRGRWWPLPVLHRTVQTPTASDTAEYRPSPIPATNGHAPTVIGRTQTMFSPVKAITAGALVFAIGGLFLVAQPLEPQRPAAPATEMTTLPGVTVTVTVDCPVEPACSWTASDPRLTGTGTGHFTGDISDDRPGEGLRTGLNWLDHELDGPEGSWSGREYLMWTDPFQHFLVLSGSGAYEGWHYVAMATSEAPPPIDWTGVLYEGELPPFGPLPTPTGD